MSVKAVLLEVCNGFAAGVEQAISHAAIVPVQLSTGAIAECDELGGVGGVSAASCYEFVRVHDLDLLAR